MNVGSEESAVGLVWWPLDRVSHLVDCCTFAADVVVVVDDVVVSRDVAVVFDGVVGVVVDAVVVLSVDAVD